MRCLLVVVNGLSTQVINKPSALNVALSLHYYNLNQSMEDRTGSTSQLASSYELRSAQAAHFSYRAADFSATNLSRACSTSSQRFTEPSCLPTITSQVARFSEPRTAQAADFSDRAADFSATNLSRACSTGSQRFTEPSCLPTITSQVARFSEPRIAQATDFSDRAAKFSATNLSRARGTGSQQFTEPSCSLETNASRPLFDTRAFLANNLSRMRLKYPGVDDRFFLEGVENLRQFHQGVEKDLLISCPLPDVRSSVESVSTFEPRGESNSVGSLALNSVDNSSFPGDSDVPAEPLNSGATGSLAACDWRCSEENLLVGNLSAGVLTVSVQLEMAVDIPAG